MGRSRAITESIETKLAIALQNGLSITQACLEVGISRDTFYATLTDIPGFSDKMEKAQQFASVIARRNIIQALNAGDKSMSQWYLERKDKDYKPKADLTTNDQPLTTSLVEFVGDDAAKDDKS